MIGRYLHTALSLGGAISVPLLLFQCRTSSHDFASPLGSIEHPVDNPLTAEKIELGRTLFFDTRLSIDESISCASCHHPEWAFTDRKAVSEGVEGRRTNRNSPSLLNAGFLPTVMFDAHLETLEMQVGVPIQEHVEMDINMVDLLARLSQVPEYRDAARRIFDREFDAWVLSRSIAAFERSLVSDNSRFDRYMYAGDSGAMNASEIAGWKLFSDKLYCTQCHPAPYFTNYQAENNGLYVDYGEDKGRFRIHHDSTDIGKFKVPSLRNIELTYPYMHDGSRKTLDDVLDHYMGGGAQHINKSEIVQPFELSMQERTDLKNFFKALTDTSYMQGFR